MCIFVAVGTAMHAFVTRGSMPGREARRFASVAAREGSDLPPSRADSPHFNIYLLSTTESGRRGGVALKGDESLINQDE